MKKQNLLMLVVSAAAVLSLVSCGGGMGSADLSAGLDNSGAGASQTVLHELGAAVPVIPASVGGVASRSASDLVEIPGSAAIESAGGTVQEENLLLQSSETDMAWGLYKIDGLAGRQPTSIEIKLDVPADVVYSVGISNYSQGVWDFIYTGSDALFQMDLSAETAQMANEIGELYFVVVVSGGASLSIHSASLESAIDDDNTDELPRLADGVSASEGLADRIEVAWLASDGATGYELWRKADIEGTDGEEDVWALLATLDAATLTYTDTDITLSVEYKYRVRALSDAGAAGFSDDDSGYAGDPPANDDNNGGDGAGQGGNGGNDDTGGDAGQGGNGGGDDTGGDAGQGGNGGNDDTGGDAGQGGNGGNDDTGSDAGQGGNGGNDDTGGDAGQGGNGGNDDTGGNDNGTDVPV